MAKRFYTLDEILNMSQRDLMKMTDKEIRKVISSQRSIARKRLERLEAKEEYTPSLSDLMRSGGIPTVKGMDKISLINEYKRYRKFLGAVTSTVTGAKKVRQNAVENLKKGISDNIELPKDIKGNPISGELKEIYLNELDKYMSEHPKEVWEIVDYFRDKPEWNFNYNAVKAIATQKLYAGTGRGNRGALIYSIKHTLEKAYTESERDRAKNTGFLVSDAVPTQNGIDWIKESFK